MNDGDNGVGWIIFAIVCFIISIIAFKIAMISGTILCYANGVVRITDSKYIRAVLWLTAGIFLTYIQLRPHP